MHKNLSSHLVFIFIGFICFSTISKCNIENKSQRRSFEIDYENNTFLKDGEPFRYVSGSIHYFRSPRERWNDLLRKIRLAGLNTITTYIAWNLHQPHSNAEYDFEGNLNVFEFLQLAQDNDLLVIMRPGPYIDAERDMGGLPAWLLWEKPNIQLRTGDLEYIYFVSRWFDELLPRLEPFLYINGGPIITMQVENEYGSYGCDKNYTTFIRDLIKLHLGEKLVLFSTDGAGESYVKCGSLPRVYPSVDFGSESAANVNKSFAVQRIFAPKGPLINSEFYPGWLDHWQKPHSKVSSRTVANALDAMLSLGANINFYMFHGGTSFGYGAGANIDGDMYDPCPTSYDYDAPLDESGDPTVKYFAIKNVISKYLTVPTEDPVSKPKAKYGKVSLQLFTTMHNEEFLTVFGGRLTTSATALSFEELKIGSGFVLYQTLINFRTSDPTLLKVPELKDRAYIYVDQEFVGVLSRAEFIFAIPIRIRMGQTISFLVENQGRVCFGKEIGESKGLGNNITLGKTSLSNWTIFPLGEIEGKKLMKYSFGLKDSSLQTNQNSLLSLRNKGSGTFYTGNFTLPSSDSPILDTFIRLDGFSKGVVWINGINVGKYWPNVGPQETLYLPAPFLKPAPYQNTLIIFELQRAPEGCLISNTADKEINDKCFITLTDTHIIDAPTPFDGEAKARLFSRSSLPQNIEIENENPTTILT